MTAVRVKPERIGVERRPGNLGAAAFALAVLAMVLSLVVEQCR